jgi:chromosome segregation ATPase
LLARNVELKAKSTQYLRVSSEKESLLQEINNAEAKLIEVSSEIKVEDSLIMTLAAKMKELQARMDDCKARMATK